MLRGVAEVTLAAEIGLKGEEKDKKKVLEQKKAIMFPFGTCWVPRYKVHTVKNIGKVPLRILEIQVGEYVEEDDIERFDIWAPDST